MHSKKLKSYLLYLSEIQYLYIKFYGSFWSVYNEYHKNSNLFRK